MFRGTQDRLAHPTGDLMGVLTILTLPVKPIGYALGISEALMLIAHGSDSLAFETSIEGLMAGGASQ